MVRRSETLGTTGRVTAAKEAKEAARRSKNTIKFTATVVDDDFPELNR